MAFFKEYRDKYREKHKDDQIEDYASQVNGREGTTTEDPAKLGNHKNLTKAERARQAEYYEQ